MTAENQESMIRLRDVNKTYFGAVPLHVLKGINLDVRKGELVSFSSRSTSYPI